MRDGGPDDWRRDYDTWCELGATQRVGNEKAKQAGLLQGGQNGLGEAAVGFNLRGSSVKHRSEGTDASEYSFGRI